MKFGDLHGGDVFSDGRALWWVRLTASQISDDGETFHINAAFITGELAGELICLGDDDEVEVFDIDNLIKLRALCEKWYRLDVNVEASDET